MSTEPTATEVFEEVEADPDAILEACDAESPEALVESGGDHEATTDPEIDADDETAAALFADLQSTSSDSIATDESTGGDETVGENATAASDDADESDEILDIDGSDAVVDADAVYVAEPTVTVSSDDGRDVSMEIAETSDTESADGPRLVGPEPTPTRVENDAFGGADPVANLNDFQWFEGSAAETRY